MAKKQQPIPMWGWAIIGLLVIILLNQKGYINIPFIPGVIVAPPQILETPKGVCNLTLDKYLITAGETIVGTIYDGPFATCDVYVSLDGGTWESMGTYLLDSNGYFSYETPVPIPGVYEILAICTDSMESCKTNTEILTVQTPEEPEEPL